MELRHLRYYVTAARTLNFSQAAQQLAISQSTLSQQIQQLEAELGVQLFRRNSHSVLLTEEGRELLSSAVDALSAAQACKERLADIKGLSVGTLNIGVTYSFSPILTETVITFMKKYPRIKLNVFYKTMEELMTMLVARDVDFVLAFKPLATRDGIDSHVLFDTHLSAIVRPGHPLADCDSVSLADLQRYELALPSCGLQARNAFDSLISGRALDYKVRIELNEVNILLKLVKNTDIVTVLSEATVYGDNQVRALRIMDQGNNMTGCIHTLRNSYRKRSAVEFLKLLSESNAVLERRNSWING